MISFSVTRLVFIALILFTACTKSASAGLITYQQTQLIESDAQQFVFQFNNLTSSDGSGAILTIEGNGDYSSYNTADNRIGEWADIYFEQSLGSLRVSEAGEISNTVSGALFASLYTEDFRDASDELFSISYHLSPTLFSQILVDNDITFYVNNGPSVQAWWAKERFDMAYNPDYLSISLSYPIQVNEPAGLFIFALAFLAFFNRRKAN